MNFKSAFYTFSVALSGTLLVSCTDVVEPSENAPAPRAVITVSSPSEGDMFMLGDTVHIHGDIEYTPGLHGYAIELTNISADSVVFSMDEHAHDPMLHFDEMWVNNVTDHSDMRLVVSAAIDHDGTLVHDTVHFHCHPM